MPARIIIDVEKEDDLYLAKIVGTDRIGGWDISISEALRLVGKRLEDDGFYSQQDRDIAARIMAEIEGEQ